MGYYVLQTYASAVGLSAVEVQSNYRNRYTEQGIASLGEMSGGVNFEALADQFRQLVHQYEQDGRDPADPIKADLNQALITVGGMPPSKLDSALSAAQDTVAKVEEVGGKVVSWGKWVIPLAIIGLIVWKGGDLVKLFKEPRSA